MMALHRPITCYAVAMLCLGQVAMTAMASLSNVTEFELTFTPEALPDLMWIHTETVTMDIMCNSTNIDDVTRIRIISNNPDVAYVKGESSFMINCSVFDTVEFDVYGRQLGHASLDVTVEMDDMTSYVYTSYQVTVLNNKTILNDVFIAVVAIMIIILSFGFGCRINIGDIKQILKKPVAPAIGLCCQFILMPLLGIGLTQALDMDPVLGFGLFVVSCSPGGGGSNVWTVMLDGDLELSMTMTFFSKTLALGTMPLWLFVAGRLYGDISVHIPYRNLTIGLLSIAIPCLIGIALKWRKPKAADFISKTVKMISVIFLVWLIVVGSIANYYVYYVMIQKWYILPAAILLPYIGVIVGGVCAAICKQSRARVITIAIETGVQDTGVAILLLLSSFGRPAGSVASAVPIAAAIFTPIPFAIGAIFILIYKRCWRTGKCHSCGGPDLELKLKAEEIFLRVDSIEGSPAEDICSNQYKYTCDVIIDKDTYVDDVITDVTTKSYDVTKNKNGVVRKSKKKSSVHDRGDGIEINGNDSVANRDIRESANTGHL